jgi:glycerol-1-phosphate dehydrogenase [NAD(P)+]
MERWSIILKNVHRIQLPREVIIGHGVLNRIGEICKSLGFTSSALLLTGPRTYKIAAEKTITALENDGIEVTSLIVKKSEMKYIIMTERKVATHHPRVILGVGGGKVIDVGKIAALKSTLPFISIPTVASHDGIASPRASIKDFELPASIPAQMPAAIIADTEIIRNAPYRLTASGCGDIISKYTSVRDWKLAKEMKDQYYGEYSASLAMMSARLVMRNTKIIKKRGEEGISIVLEALISCGIAMGIAGSSAPCSGSEHLFSHALDKIASTPALHGEQCGVGAIMMAHLHKANWKLLRNSLRKLKAPTTAEELGVKPEHIIRALMKAHKIRSDRYTILGENGLTEQEATHLAKITGVIE